MKKRVLVFVFLFLMLNLYSQKNRVTVNHSEYGMKLVVDGADFMINGVNWDYFPIGTNYSYNLWSQKDTFIMAALDSEMTMLKNMGVNTIRVYIGIQPKWITYIYENYGIYTMLNHPFGRYGLFINGKMERSTDYSDSEVQRILISEVSELASSYKNTPGLLLFLLGNENNYGLFWAGAETEDFPDNEEEKNEIGERRGRAMYQLMNAAAIAIKKIDDKHPVAICNGDILYIDIVAEECKDVDIYGTNMYRGSSFGDAFELVKKKLKMPILFTEFGADAYNAILQKEDQAMQAFYMVENWREIYENAAGLGKAENSIGGFTFQFSDGWWKYGQTINLEKQNVNASWASSGYHMDYDKGRNNMNEEWFGICAKGARNNLGLYPLYPRAAYFALQEVHQLDPFLIEMNLNVISEHFQKIILKKHVLKAKEQMAILWKNE
jgi:hypothetical protein